VLDVVANWIGNWPSLHGDPARLPRPLGLLPITLFGVFVLVTVLLLLRVWMTDYLAQLPRLQRTTRQDRQGRRPGKRGLAGTGRQALAFHLGGWPGSP
jgi:hypothetical protein